MSKVGVGFRCRLPSLGDAVTKTERYAQMGAFRYITLMRMDNQPKRVLFSVRGSARRIS